jgi:RNA polymerase sigma-70 factor (ECF subfamily)
MTGVPQTSFEPPQTHGCLGLSEFFVQIPAGREYIPMDSEPKNRDSRVEPPGLGRPIGIHEEFMTLLMEHQGGLRGYLRSLVPTWNDVDDVIQQVSLVAWRKFDNFERGTNFLAWIMVIARLEALKHRRGLARGPQLLAEDLCELLASEPDAATFEPREIDRQRTALEHCLSRLDDGRRRLLLEAHAPGVRINALARRAGRSEQAVYKVIQRLRAMLVECMQSRLAREGGR